MDRSLRSPPQSFSPFPEKRRRARQPGEDSWEDRMPPLGQQPMLFDPNLDSPIIKPDIGLSMATTRAYDPKTPFFSSKRAYKQKAGILPSAEKLRTGPHSVPTPFDKPVPLSQEFEFWNDSSDIGRFACMGLDITDGLCGCEARASSKGLSIDQGIRQLAGTGTIEPLQDNGANDGAVGIGTTGYRSAADVFQNNKQSLRWLRRSGIGKHLSRKLMKHLRNAFKALADCGRAQGLLNPPKDSWPKTNNEGIEGSWNLCGMLSKLLPNTRKFRPLTSIVAKMVLLPSIVPMAFASSLDSGASGDDATSGLLLGASNPAQDSTTITDHLNFSIEDFLFIGLLVVSPPAFYLFGKRTRNHLLASGAAMVPSNMVFLMTMNDQFITPVGHWITLIMTLTSTATFGYLLRRKYDHMGLGHWLAIFVLAAVLASLCPRSASSNGVVVSQDDSPVEYLLPCLAFSLLCFYRVAPFTSPRDGPLLPR